MFCSNLKEHVAEITNCEKKEMLPLTKKQEKKYKKQNLATYANKNSMTCLMRMKIIVGFGIIVITQGNR